GAGSLPNVSSILVNAAGSFVVDNAGTASNDRIRDSAGITLAGGGLEFRGNETVAVSETVGVIQANSNYSSSITTISRSPAVTLSANNLGRQAGSYVAFRGLGQDLGSTANRLLFHNPLTPLIVGNILPFATVARASDLDFATYDLARGVVAAAARTTLAGATA